MTELLGSEVVLIIQNAWLLKYVVAMEVLYYNFDTTEEFFAVQSNKNNILHKK